MCGLVMVVTKNQNGFNSKQQDVFDTLLFLDTLRGEDSTGAFVVDNLGNVKLAKAADQAPVYMMTKEYKELSIQAFRTGWAMVGHNRKATKGSITDANAHPFVVDDNIVLVHNGTFNCDHRKIKDTEVDSEAIAHALNENSDVEATLRTINAAYALIWYNVAKKQLNMIRNFSRPLWYMETSDSYIVASEEAFLKFVIDKHNLTPKEKPYELKEYNLFTLTLEDNKTTDTNNTELDCSYHKHNPYVSTNTTSMSRLVDRRHFSEMCGWEGYEHDVERWYPQGNKDCEDADPFDQSVTVTVPVKPVVTNLKEQMPIENNKTRISRFMDTVNPNPRTMLYKDWLNFKESYKEGQKIKVIIDDMTEADDIIKTKNFLMIGRTLDENHAYVLFPFTEDNFTNLLAMANEGVFEVEVDGFVWRRTEPLDTLKTTIEDWAGVAVIEAMRPVPIYTQDMSEHAS